VIDASVGVKWFLNESDSAPARAILQEIGQHQREFVVPELFLFEVYAVCMRRHPDPQKFATDGIKLLHRIPLTRVPMTEELAALGYAFIKFGLTGYDAVYAALAKKVSGHWITYDKEAAKRLKHPDWVEVLGR